MKDYELLWMNLRAKILIADNGNYPNYKYQAIVELMDRMEDDE